MIPISDINPAKNKPIITRIFIATCILTYIFLQPKEPYELFNFFYRLSAIPCELFNNTPLTENQYLLNDCFANKTTPIFLEKNILLSIIYANFFHANFLHILGNLWSFWIFGNNIEDKLGKIKFIIFILLVGLTSILFHSILNYSSLIPIVGASGIVSGLMGAYVKLFPNARLLVLVPFGFIFPTTIKAKFFMIVWFISQFYIAINVQGISWEAHISGFIFGYFLVNLFK
ncbi:MAG: rhomboid family intramembrane serine protease [Actinomycetota bacterium]|nr:rhomboid family intramembrane serine protease [Actinomycetota bacterium]MDA3013020.1 rhomboid family intramembrane serine protease [Actinomycetota bacterium]